MLAAVHRPHGEIAEVVGARAKVARELADHVVLLAVVDEVPEALAAQAGLQRLRDVERADAERLRPVAIDAHAHLGPAELRGRCRRT